MQFLHTMIRAANLADTLSFFCDHLGLVEVNRYDSEQGRFTLVFLAAPKDLESAAENQAPLVEITHNWDPEDYDGGRNFGHLAYRVEDIYALCERLMTAGVTINRPPRDGRMAFVRSPDGISVELLQAGPALEPRSPGHRWKILGFGSTDRSEAALRSVAREKVEHPASDPSPLMLF